MKRTIKTERPRKGDLVVGHKVYACLPGTLPAVPGEIDAVSPSGHAVTLKIDNALAAMGLPKRSTWTWRRSVGAYQQAGERTSHGWGLVLARSPAPGVSRRRPAPAEPAP